MKLVEFGNFIRLLRVSKGMTLKTAANQMGIGKTMLDQIELGCYRRFPKHGTLEAIAEFYDFRFQYIPEQLLLIRPPKPYEEPEQPKLELPDLMTLKEAEIYLITEALKKFGGDRLEAALYLGIGERTIYRKMRQYEL